MTRRSMKKNFNFKEIENLIRGQDIDDAIDASPDPAQIESFLNPGQVEALQEFRSKKWEDLHSAMQTEVEARLRASGKSNKIVPMLKLRVVDPVSDHHGTLSIWRPNEDLIQGLKEKIGMRVFNVAVGSIRDRVINLKSTKKIRFERRDADGIRELNYDRKIQPIEDILQDDFAPNFKEVDVLGKVNNIF